MLLENIFPEVIVLKNVFPEVIVLENVFLKHNFSVFGDLYENISENIFRRRWQRSVAASGGCRWPVAASGGCRRPATDSGDRHSRG